MLDLVAMGKTARAASRKLAHAPTEQKNAALYAIADCIDSNADSIRAANTLDLEAARGKGIGDALIDRLSLQGKRLAAITADVRNVAALPDPVGEVIEAYTLPNGLRLSRRRIAIGVFGVIYEARPNVTADVATLSLKSGNAVILRGGSETIRSNQALVNVVQAALVACGLPTDAVQLIGDPDRRYVGELLRLNDYVDMIIPRGGQSLHQFCRENSTIPVITGGIGINHYYIDPTVDQESALRIIHNAKTQRPTVCNALGTLLVHEAVAEAFLPRVVEHLAASGVTFRADPKALALLATVPDSVEKVSAAGPDDWDTEWLSLILGLKVVSGMDEAIGHIEQHGTAHSDGILTEDMAQAAEFLNRVDSAAVYVNASTRFTDGGQFGLGAEIAVSTQKIQARGPMALRELTSYKWVVEGDGQVRD